jgi:tetratricopeptide (TPR) repeat protein
MRTDKPKIGLFISYAREDENEARRLYNDLKNAGLNPWLDKENILPGKDWTIAIKRAIEQSRFFIPLFSSYSVSKRGYIQKEFRYALDYAKIFPPDDVFIIPVKLDECEIPYEDLSNIHHQEMFPDWNAGIKKILQAITQASSKDDEKTNAPTVTTDDNPAKTSQVVSSLPPFRGEKKVFVNREEYINSKIKQYLKPSFPVAIIGPGGSGKSQLAFKAIHKYQKEGMFDLVIPIYLDAGVITFDQFLLKIADKLGIPKEQFEKYDVDQRKDTITSKLSSKSNPLILVDNFETLLYAVSSSSSSSSDEYNDQSGNENDNDNVDNDNTVIAQKNEEESTSPKDNAIQIKDYLNNNIPDNTSILITSRERFNLDREKRIDLEGLKEDDSNKLFESLAIDEQLSEISMQQESRQKINNLIKKTGGHPLSIEILAKNIRGIEQVEQVSERLGDYVNINEPIKRLSSLRESLDFTIKKLDYNLKELLYNLTLFKSPFPISAAINIFGAKKADILNLYERTMLSRIESDDVYGIIKNPEYWLYKLHPAVRNYLEGEMPKDLEGKYGEAFCQYYRNLLSDTCNTWSKINHISAKARFNIIAGSEYNDFDRAIELANKENRKVGAEISSWLGLIFKNLGELTTSLLYHQESLAIDKELNDRAGLARDYSHIGTVLDNMGNYKEALNYLDNARAIHEERNDKVGMAADYSHIGLVEYNRGNYKEALECHKKSLDIDQELGNRDGMAKDYCHIGLVEYNRGRYQEALEYHNKSRAIHEDLKDKDGMAKDYCHIGNVLFGMGRNEEALETHNKALEIHKELNDTVGMAKDYGNIGNALRNMRNHKEALNYLDKARAIHEERNDKVGMAADYKNTGLVFRNMRNLEEALNYLDKARAIHEELNDKVGMAADYGNIGIVLDDKTNREEALNYLDKARAIHEELNDKVGMAADYGNISLVSRNMGNSEEAQNYLDKARAIHEELNDKVGMAADYGKIHIVFPQIYW